MSDQLEIVLIEDNPTDAELIQRVFKKHNLVNNAILLKDGAEAIEFFFGRGPGPHSGNESPRVIVLDLKLPKVNGDEVLRRLREDERTRSIPVVILTSSNEQRDIQECYDIGINSYVTKPINFEDFSRVVAELGMYWMMLNKPPVQTR